jgi:D-3-phosphoglycerate dehydrogenase
MKPKMIVYKCCHLQPSVYEFLNRETDLQFFKNPDELFELHRDGSTNMLREAEILWMPLGYEAPGLFQFTNLKAVVSNTTSSDHIPKIYKEAGIKVITLEDDREFLLGIKATAEHTWGLIHAIHRRIPAAHAHACSGYWDRRAWSAPKMLCRMTLGIIGNGRIGRIVGGIGREIMKEVFWYDPEIPMTSYAPAGRKISLLGLIGVSDILAVCCASTPYTHNLIDAGVFRLMDRQAILVNTARGEIVNSTDLLDALRLGKIRGAALDVVPGDTEAGHPKEWQHSHLLGYAKHHDNLILTPHIAGSTVDAWEETEMRVAQRAVEAFHNDRRR